MTTIHSYHSMSFSRKDFNESALTVSPAQASVPEDSYRYQGYKLGHGRRPQEER